MSIKQLKLNSVFALITLLAIALLLSACSVLKTKAESKSILNYPEGVQNGSVTIKYYDELQSYFELDTQHQKILEDIFESIDENPKLIYSSEKVDEFSKSINSYNDFLINFNPIGTTEVEKELSVLFMDITKSQLALNSSLVKYFNSKNRLHFFPMAYQNDENKDKKEKVVELSKKYKIFTE